jgi:tetratricopeptide (TPR) repeat protein
MRFVAIILVLAASAAHADRSRDPMKRAAREHFDRGRTLYQGGDYAEAVGELELGRKLDPHPDFQYALGQAYRKLGDCKRAVEHYVAFLETDPPQSEAALVKKKIARCPTETEPKPAVTPVEAPTELTPPAPAPPTALTEEPRVPIAITRSERPAPAWYTDAPGGVLAGAGLGGLAVGVTYLVLADRDIAAANAAKPIARLHELAASGHHERTIGVIGMVAGGALAVAAAVRYYMVARDRRSPKHSMSVAADRTGVFAVWTGQF